MKGKRRYLLEHYVLSDLLDRHVGTSAIVKAMEITGAKIDTIGNVLPCHGCYLLHGHGIGIDSIG